MTVRNQYSIPLDGSVEGRALAVALSMTLRGFTRLEATEDGYRIRASGADGGVGLLLEIPASGRGEARALHVIDPDAEGIPPGYRGDPQRLARDLQFATGAAVGQSLPLAVTLQSRGGPKLKLEDTIELPVSPRAVLGMLRDAFEDLHGAGGNAFSATLNENGLTTNLTFAIVGRDPVGPTRVSIEMLREVPMNDDRVLDIRSAQGVLRTDRGRIVDLLNDVAAELRAAPPAVAAAARPPAAAHQPPSPRRRAIAPETWRGFSLG